MSKAKLSRADRQALKTFVSNRRQQPIPGHTFEPPKPKFLAWVIRSLFRNGVPW